MLGLIQLRTRLDYLPSKASLITSSADHPKKTKSTLCVQKQEVSVQRSTHKVTAQMPRQKCAVPKLDGATLHIPWGLIDPVLTGLSTLDLP